jgi:hypothetical protein
MVSLELDVRKARALGWPAVRLPIDTNNTLWILFQPYVWMLVDSLPIAWAQYPDLYASSVGATISKTNRIHTSASDPLGLSLPPSLSTSTFQTPLPSTISSRDAGTSSGPSRNTVGCSTLSQPSPTSLPTIDRGLESLRKVHLHCRIGGVASSPEGHCLALQRVHNDIRVE